MLTIEAPHQRGGQRQAKWGRGQIRAVKGKSPAQAQQWKPWLRSSAALLPSAGTCRAGRHLHSSPLLPSISQCIKLLD